MLCERVDRCKSGGMSIIGISSILWTDRLPGTFHDDLTIAVRLRGAPNETGECVLSVIDPNGVAIKTNPSLTLPTAHPGIIDFHASLVPLSLRGVGLYEVAVSVNGVELKRVAMPVHLMTGSPNFH